MLDVTLKLFSHKAEWGEKVRGAVRLEAVRHVAVPGLITVSLTEGAIPPLERPAVATAYRGLWAPSTVAPGKPREVRFDLRIPWRYLPPGQARITARVEWSDQAPGGPSRAHQGKAEATLPLGPPEDLALLLEVVGEVTGTRFSEWRAAAEKEEGVHAVLLPEVWEERLFDEVVYELDRRRPAGRGVRYDGRVRLNLREHSAADHVRSALWGNDASVEVRLRSDNLEAARQDLGMRLRRYLDPAWSLPRPAGPPRETLPRPSQAPHSRRRNDG